MGKLYHIYTLKSQEKATSKIRRLGRLLILAGVAVWAPYFVLKVAGRDPQLAYFLPFHLAGVVPGAILSRWHQIKRLLGRSYG